MINEPHLHTDEGHSFLESYYQQAILAAREFLDPSVPIVLFDWTYEMCKWDDNAFPESIYGKVAWPNALQLTQGLKGVVRTAIDQIYHADHCRS